MDTINQKAQANINEIIGDERLKDQTNLIDDDPKRKPINCDSNELVFQKLNLENRDETCVMEKEKD